MAHERQIEIAFFGDDFTGSTDALESLTRAGLKTMLFLEPPTPEQLAKWPGLEAVGVAGLTRSLVPEAMAAVLRPALMALKTLRPKWVHYKVCSTFDSSPEVGSIGRAIDVGAEIFGVESVPVLAAAPALGRYCVFGNLFARYGIGSAGAIHRLDRHPSISRHPVTPMTEADLRVHLGRQTSRRIGLVDLIAIEAGGEKVAEAWAREVAAGCGAIFFDAVTTGQLGTIGQAWRAAENEEERTRFVVGSSGVGTALTAYRDRHYDGGDARPVERLLVVSGSCSPVTAGQIAWAEANDFVVLVLAADGDNAVKVEREAGVALGLGRSVIVCTSRGEAVAPMPAAELGARLGDLARAIVEDTRVKRVVVAGGDTSSYAARAMGIVAVEMLARMAPGAPLCRAVAPGSPLDEGEVVFKGGQVGAEDYFGAVKEGRF